jgi:hypothetical protein
LPAFSTYSQQLPTFRGLRFDEDYTFLKNDSVEKNFHNKLKFISLNKNASLHLSIGGEIRQEFDALKMRIGASKDWALIISTFSAIIFMQIYTLAITSDSSQFRSALENGRKDGPRPIDQDNLNMQNFFAEYSLMPSATQKLFVRFGRQEMFFGSQRLITLRDGPNLRFAFDAIRMGYRKNNVIVDAIAASDINVNTGIFDNKRTKELNLWGIYSSINFKSMPNTNIDLYYLGIHRPAVRYEEGFGKEGRKSAGARFWNKSATFNYDIETIIQWGKFGKGSILAWTASSSIAYTINPLKKQATLIGLKTDVISGDGQLNDGMLGTFNRFIQKQDILALTPKLVQPIL